MSKQEALEALWRLTYGMYVVSSRVGDRMNGQISDALMQVTIEPPRVAVSVSRNELTHELIVKSGLVGVSVLAPSVPKETILLFGFRSGRDTDKFEFVDHREGVTGVPLLVKDVVSVFEGKAVESVDLGTHTVFVVDVVDGQVVADGPPLTYAYYQEHMRGATHKNAPTYRPQ
jgi:ferric-chelate reductase [NAD(P)H]